MTDNERRLADLHVARMEQAEALAVLRQAQRKEAAIKKQLLDDGISWHLEGTAFETKCLLQEVGMLLVYLYRRGRLWWST